jgi:hypothetical protein
MLALPKMMAPPSRNFDTMDASFLVAAPPKHNEPAVLFMPSMLIESFKRNEMPCNLLRVVSLSSRSHTQSPLTLAVLLSLSPRPNDVHLPELRD